jgi:hypothetical protein
MSARSVAEVGVSRLHTANDEKSALPSAAVYRGVMF